MNFPAMSAAMSSQRGKKFRKRNATGRIDGLVLDLRSNPGGSLDEAVALSDLFLSEGRIVSQRGRARGENIAYDAETVFRGDIAGGLPMVVLIDAGSASASKSSLVPCRTIAAPW